MEVAPALGCTEPVAIALAAAAAASLLPQREFDQLELWVDPNIYKNGIAVTIPAPGASRAWTWPPPWGPWAATPPVHAGAGAHQRRGGEPGPEGPGRGQGKR